MLQRVLQLDIRQARAAHRIWRQATLQLSRLQTEQGEILSQIRCCDAQPAAWHHPASYSASRQVQLLQQVAELSENALLQHEVLRHTSRLFVWEVCSPNALAQAICHAWPAFPDMLGSLRAVAAFAPAAK